MNTLKLFLVGIACSLSIKNIEAQFRAKVGFTYSEISYHSVINANLYSPSLGFTGGIYYSKILNSTLGVETGVSYFNIGATKSKQGNLDWKHSYLGIPLVLSIQPSAILSPGIGVMFSKKIKSDMSFDNLYDSTLDFSGMIRINFNIFPNISFELGYNHGFIPFSEVVETDSIGEVLNVSKYTNRHLFLTVNFRM